MWKIESEKLRKNKNFWSKDNKKKKEPKQDNFLIVKTGKM